jgi:hypothetical protein
VPRGVLVSLSQREDITRGVAQGSSGRVIAQRLLAGQLTL